MLRKCLCCLLMCCLILGRASVRADVHVDETPPEDWQERDLMRLTVFRTDRKSTRLNPSHII